MHSHLPRLLFHLAPRFTPRLCRYFCSASVLTLQSPCIGNQSPAASSASWAGLCSLGPGFSMGWTLENEEKATPSLGSFGSTLAQLDGAQHPHPVTDCAGCWQGCALMICLPWCPCSSVLAGPGSLASLWGHFHRDPGFVRASFLVSSL